MCKECSPKRAAKAARLEVQAERLGDLQKFLNDAPFVPAIVVLAAAAGIGAATKVIEGIHIPL